MRNPGNAAFAYWDGKIAPVFDVARQVLLVEKAPDAQETASERTVLALPETADGKADLLRTSLVTTLVCGAISRPLQEAVQGRGILVLPFVMGDTEELIRAWRTDQLKLDAFLMPGCRGRGGNRPGKGQGNRGGHQGYQGGRTRARGTAGMEQACACPGCGYRVTHTPGTPCVRILCPHCGKMLVRAK